MLRITVEIPKPFLDKFTALIHNINAVNSDKDPPIRIIKVDDVDDEEIVAVPK